MSDRELVRVPDWIRIVEANVAPGADYWFVKKVEYQDDTLSGGLHHIFVEQPHDIAQSAHVSNGQETWPVVLEKPQGEPAGNFPMFGGNFYSCEMNGAPSDRVEGMHMPSKHHVNYRLWWEKRRKGNQPMGGDPTGGTTPVPGGGTTIGQRTLAQSLVQRGDTAQLIEFNKNAAIQKVIFTDGFLPNSREFELTFEGKTYIGQRAERLNDGEVRIYYVEKGKFDKVMFVKK